MRAFVALVRREYLQHRGAFLYAPLILIGVVTFLIAASFVSGRYHYYASGPVPGTGYRLFDTLYLGISALWGGYLFIALFFYFADAFNADRRNNQMFFWKSMPRTDFSILMSKLTAGLTILPLLVYFALLLTGVIAAAATFVAPFALPLLALPDLGGTVTAYLQVSATALGYLVVLLLWYAPFFAWVGALSTVVGRWSIPLALLIPVVISLFEGVIDFGSAPGGSYLLTFLRERLSFSFDIGALQAAVLANQPIDVPGLLSRLVTTTNWLSLVLGLVFAVAVIWAASEYRRRRVLKG
jgi:ABC-2 type transport system permease protein